MVFKSLTLFARIRGPDEFWRKRKIFKLAAHFYGRRRNCYSITIKGIHKSLMFCFRGRKLRRRQISDLWNTRLEAACLQHGISPKILKEGLSRNEMFLNRKVLVDLAIWEPRTFKSLAKIAWSRCKIDGLNDVQHLNLPTGVITRGMLK
ncbi:GSCOCG00006792001-RA-CDS [Cotesia congregata]|uniref:Mitochondrial (Xenopus laevis) n=1 Tax=Cotesia congregata TaxID=51543 RepID=A0A8J2MXI3_COTCN|nr:GSCOCG00006792001-RA-CDS [Cotesia congregata]CAG5103529.1 Similar to mrpl20: 39S ribosomal protein L20 [Cotesia congregata]